MHLQHKKKNAFNVNTTNENKNQTPIAFRARIFFHPLTKLQEVAKNPDWFIALYALVLICHTNYFGFSFSTVLYKPL